MRRYEIPPLSGQKASHSQRPSYRCSGRKQLDPEDLEQVCVYIKVHERAKELSSTVQSKPMRPIERPRSLLIDAVFFDAYHLKVRSIQVPLNLALYLNLPVDRCGRGSDLAWGGPRVAKEESPLS